MQGGSQTAFWNSLKAPTEMMSLNDTPTRQNTRLFQGRRIALTERAKAYVVEVVDRLLAWESEHYPRTRKRKSEDLAQFRAQVEALVCDLIHRELTCPGCYIAITLRALNEADCYRAPVLTMTIRHVLQLMEEAGFIGIVKGNNSEGWKLSVSTAVWWKTGNHGITLDDLGEALGELIYLREYRQYSDPEITKKKPVKLDAKNKQYKDTRDTREWRRTMQTINDWLSLADIAVVSDAVDKDED